jgi:hypothetical protein
MIFCKELNRTFETQAKMFAALLSEKQTIISLKKAAIKTTDSVQFGFVKGTTAVKSEAKDLDYGDYIYPVINTTNYLDSHNDMHLNGIWDKSAKEQNGKIYYAANHKLELGSIISYPKEVEIILRKMKWQELGKDYPGETEALIFKAQLTEKSQRDAYLAFKAGEDIQQSVRMEYVNIDLAVDSKDKEFKHEKALFDKLVKVMANPETAAQRGYFWAVSEAKIYKEGSAVLFGSNDATTTLYDLNDTSKQPLSGTVAQPSGINIKKILQNF